MRSQCVVIARSHFTREVTLFPCGGKRKIGDWPGVFWKRSWGSLDAAFPERQIFVRTDGRVRFFVLGPSLQIIMAGSILLLVGWVIFTSINVIVQDRIF